jgi:hypothetical protein
VRGEDGVVRLHTWLGFYYENRIFYSTGFEIFPLGKHDSCLPNENIQDPVE